jgi:tRNA(Ile)-lysidine synthase
LLLLHTLAKQRGLQLTVLHFDHQLRPESGQEAEFVRQLAIGRGLACHIGREDVGERMRQKGQNLEEAARQARYSFFAAICSELGIGSVATGHTADDQAETVLFHLLRGSGPAGLAGMRPTSLLPVARDGLMEPAIRLIRPLLWVRRAEVRQFLEEAGQEWIEDPSNAVPNRSRNRIRHELLPWLSREFNPVLVERLCTTAEIMRGEENAWRELAAAAIQTLSCEPLEGGGLRFRLDPFRKMPLGMRRRVLRTLIETVQGDLRRVDFDHIQQLLQWIGRCPPASSDAGRGMRRVEFAGVRAEVTAHELRLRPREPAAVGRSLSTQKS